VQKRGRPNVAQVPKQALTPRKRGNAIEMRLASVWMSKNDYFGHASPNAHVAMEEVVTLEVSADASTWQGTAKQAAASEDSY